MKRLILILALFSFTNFAKAETIELKRIEFAKTKNKAVEILNVYELSSTNVQFGGISGLKIIKKNNNFDYYLLSDEGYYFIAEPNYETNSGQLKNFTIKDYKKLYGVMGESLANDKEQGDAEAIDIVNGKVVVAFERNHRVLIYENDKATHYIKPDHFMDLAYNEGIEALGIFGDQTLLITEQSESKKGFTKGFLFKKQDKIEFNYPLYKNFNPTDLVIIKNEVLVLERSYVPGKGNEMRLVQFPLNQIKQQADITPKQILHLQPPFPTDNFEALGFYPLNKDRYRLMIFSDNNFNSKQRNLLIELNYFK